MTAVAAFLADILADPADDAPRLILADFLEEPTNPEADPARAEFIRLQCESSRLPPCTGQHGCSGKHGHDGRAGQIIHGELHETDPRRPHHHHDERCGPCRACVLRARELELLNARGDHWTLAVLGGLCGDHEEVDWEGVRRVCVDLLAGLPRYRVRVGYRRGFIAEATYTPDDFCRPEVAAGLFRAAPVSAVSLAGREPRGSLGESRFGWWRESLPEKHPNYLDHPHDLPPALWDRLPGVPAGANGWRWNPTREGAMANLSAACVRFGRAAAGLPDPPGSLPGVALRT